MKRRLIPALSLVLVLVASVPVAAQDVDEDADQGLSLIEEGAKLLLLELMDEMQPKLEELQSGLGAALSGIEPALRDLVAMIDDIRNYDPPELLPNGDIIIRRRFIGPRLPEPGAEIEL